jgi:hypothetical protein
LAQTDIIGHGFGFLHKPLSDFARSPSSAISPRHRCSLSISPTIIVSAGLTQMYEGGGYLAAGKSKAVPSLTRAGVVLPAAAETM